jgi:DNA-binding CsgD family transcriptional regulator
VGVADGSSDGMDPTIAGRDEELAKVDAFLDEVERGPSCLLIDGEPGIGKTTLWLHAVSRARARGHAVLETRSAEEEMPIAGVTLLDLFGDDAVDAGDGDAGLARGRAVLGRLGALAEDGALVIAIDDLQWVDAVSGRALRFALRRLGSEPVGLIATARSGSDRYEVAPTIDAFPPGRAQVVEVPPLDLDALRKVLDPIVSSISRRLLRRIHEIAGGNPMYAIELARTLPSSGSENVWLPTSMQQAVAGRLDRVRAELTPLLDIVAAQGRADPAEAAELLPDADVDLLLSEALEQGLLVIEEGVVRFSHPLLGAAVYERMPPLARRSLHGRLAEVARDPDARARHIALSAEEPDERIARLLEEASTRARARGAHAVAAHFAGRSARVTPPENGEDRRRRVILEVHSLQAAGDSARALALAEKAIEGWPPGPQRAELLVLAAFTSSQGMDASIALTARALDEVGDDVALRCRVLEARANERSFAGDVEGALEDLRAAVAISDGLGDRLFRARLRSGLGLLELLAGTQRPDLMEDAIRLAGNELATEATDPRFDVARHVLWSGDPATARAQLQEARTLATSADLVVPATQAHYDLSILECFAGDFTSAAALAREGARWARDNENAWAESHFAYPLALIEVWTGPAAEVRAHVNRLREMAESYDARPDLIRAHWLLGLLALREGEIPEAVASLTHAVGILEDSGIVHPAPYPVLPDAIEALARAGDLEAAGDLLDRLDRQAFPIESPWISAVALRTRGVVLLASGDPVGALEPVTTAVATLDRLGFRPDAARAVMARGGALLRSGHRVAAADAFAEAGERLSAMGAEPWAARAASELERAAPGRSARQLTATEARIAALVAEGRKNREIAASLFVSVATVEAHLTRMYRKLGIGSRADLTRLVASGDVDVAPQLPPE